MPTCGEQHAAPAFVITPQAATATQESLSAKAVLDMTLPSCFANLLNHAFTTNFAVNCVQTKPKPQTQLVKTHINYRGSSGAVCHKHIRLKPQRYDCPKSRRRHAAADAAASLLCCCRLIAACLLASIDTPLSSTGPLPGPCPASNTSSVMCRRRLLHIRHVST